MPRARKTSSASGVVGPLAASTSSLARARHNEDATPGGLHAPFAAADGGRLAGDARRNREAVMHGVGVHDPGHDLGIRVDVWRRDVAVGTDHAGDLRGVAAGEALQLATTELAWVQDDAALGAAKRDVDDGALPRHPHRQSAHLVQRDVGVIADAALGRPAIDVVLNAIAGEHLDASVIHADGKVDGQLTLGHTQDLAELLAQIEPLASGVELR